MAGVIEAAWFVDARSNTVDLATNDIDQYKQGVNGRFMPPVQHIIDGVPEQDGGRYRGTRVGLPSITIPLLLCASDITTLRALHRDLARGVNPTRGPGVLHVQTEDGLHRTIPAIYESGFESDPATSGEGAMQVTEQEVALTFRGLESYWSAFVPVDVTKAKDEQTGTFFPAPPFRVGPSSIMTSWVETNDGDVGTWPVWYVSGEGRSLVVANTTTGKQLALNYSLNAAETIIIDSRPGRKTVTATGNRDLGNRDLLPTVSGDFWQLLDGENKILVQLRDVQGQASIRLVYYPKYLGV